MSIGIPLSTRQVNNTDVVVLIGLLMMETVVKTPSKPLYHQKPVMIHSDHHACNISHSIIAVSLRQLCCVCGLQIELHDYIAELFGVVVQCRLQSFTLQTQCRVVCVWLADRAA